MDKSILNAIQEAKDYCKRGMDQSELYLSYPPQHRGKDGATVEKMLSLLREIEVRATATPNTIPESQVSIEIHNLLEEYPRMPSGIINRLRNIANLSNHEYQEQIRSSSMKPVFSFLQAYEDAGGVLSFPFKQKLMILLKRVDRRMAYLEKTAKEKRSEDDTADNFGKILSLIMGKNK